MSVPSCSTELLLYPSRPTQKAAREVVEVQLTPGSVQLPVTVLKPLPVSAYPDQFVLCTWVNPLTRSAGRDTRWSAACWPTDRCSRAWRATRAAWADADLGVVLAPAAGLMASSRPSAGTLTIKKRASRRGRVWRMVGHLSLRAAIASRSSADTKFW